jgi:hypothetical protein
MQFGFMDVILLSLVWPKRVGNHYATKLHAWEKGAFLSILMYFMRLINTRIMKHIKPNLKSVSPRIIIQFK